MHIPTLLYVRVVAKEKRVKNMILIFFRKQEKHKNVLQQIDKYTCIVKGSPIISPL